VLDGLAPVNFTGTSSLTLDGDLEFDPDASLPLIRGASFYLVSGITNATSSFNNLILPELVDGLDWDTSTFYVDGVLSIVPEFSADFDKDGDVDGADFLRWQRGFGTDVGAQNTAAMADGNANGDQFIDGDDLALWLAQYGTDGIPLSALGQVVPEPGCTALVLSCLSFYLIRTPHRFCRDRLPGKSQSIFF